MERPTRAEGETDRASRGVAPWAAPAWEEPAQDPGHDLIRRAQSGDEAAFAQLVRDHQQRAFRIARQMVPSEEDARDLVQEAFLRVFKSLDRFDFQFTFSTWLHRIVTNLAIDLLRKRRLIASTHIHGDEDEAEVELPDTIEAAPSERLESQETADRVRACINSLAPHFRTVLTLRELDGLPCNEIAKIVGATHVTVRWRLHRGRKLFQEEWERRERARASGAASGTAADPADMPDPADMADANNALEQSVHGPERAGLERDGPDRDEGS
jgi:RNA polymerase sigma-70 factor (ECF subfamily)